MTEIDRGVADRTMRPICWHAESFDPTIASARLRVLQPMHALGERGYRVEQLRVVPADCAAIIFSKSDSPEALSIAETAVRQGRPIIYDICDNIFEKPSADEPCARPARDSDRDQQSKAPLPAQLGRMAYPEILLGVVAGDV